tara:strand:- start:7098 stop:11333 length:4236 start_codon:yes stop_codon:yes gene_type:complete
MKSRRRFGAASIATASLVALGAGLLTAPAVHAANDPVEILVDGANVHPENVNGLPFKGLGLISGNSTSNLLMDYKAEQPEQYWQLIEVLFGGEYPLIDHVKMEMGSDTNNSTGSEATTMRTFDELADASRSPGFQLAADAKTVNPDVKVSFLRWNMPMWVQEAWSAGTGNDEMYRWYKETILDAYEKYGYMVDYVNPDTNETRNPDVSFIKWYKNAIATDTDFSDPRYGIPADEQEAVAAAYNNIKIVASDENQEKNIGPALLTDVDLFEAVDAVGYHYNTDDRYDGDSSSATYKPYTKLATGVTPTGEDKEVWYSEGVGSFGATDYRVNNTEGPDGASTGIGGVQSALDLANRVVKSYANSKRTHYIFQPAIGSFYEGAQYSHKELVSARDPWSGYIHYDAAVYVMQHFTRFAKTGWENEDNTAGIWRTIPEASYSGVSGTENVDGSNGAPSYMTLAAPDLTDFTTVVVNDSDQTKTYSIATANLELGDDETLEVWETRASGAGEGYDDNFMHLADEVLPGTDDRYTVTVQPRSIVTFTTLDRSSDPAMQVRLPESLDRTVLDTDETGKNHDTDDSHLYADNFDYAEEGNVDVGINNGADTESVPYLESRGDQPRYMVDQTGAWEVGDVDGNGVLYQYLDQSMKNTKAWNPRLPNTLVGDFRWQNYTATVDASFPDADGGLATLGIRQQHGMGIGDAAYNLRVSKDGSWGFYRHDTVLQQGSVSAAESYTLAVEGKGADITAFIDGEAVATFTDSNPELGGRVNLGSDYYLTAFDNLTVTKIDGYAPYANALIDSMDSVVNFEGEWSHRAAFGDAADWHRSTSVTSSVGASFEVPFSGTGIDVIGANNGSARFTISVDGEKVALKAATTNTGKRQATYTLRGLSDGDHTVRFELTAGSITLDAFQIIDGNVTGAIDVDPLEEALAGVGSPVEGDYSPDTWAVFSATAAAAESALEGQAGLDAIGVAQLVERLQNAFNGLIPADISDESIGLGLIGALQGDDALPAQLTIDGEERAVTWSNASVNAERAAYSTLQVSGWTTEAYAEGKKQAFSASVEVIPAGLQYFINGGLASGQVSPQFDAIAADVELLNDSVDRVSPSATEWGHLADGITVKSGTDPLDKFSTGYWAGSNKKIVYVLPLPAGDYQLTAGFREWWDQSRTISQTVTFGDESISGTNVSLSSGRITATGTVDFTLDEATTVTYSAAKVGSQDPVLSWLAVAQVAAVPVSIDISGETELAVGDTTELVAQVAPARADQSVTWASSDSSVATVASDGTVTAIAAGSAVITATSTVDASVSSSNTITVVPAEWSAMTIYLAGDLVSYDGAVFEAQWWTLALVPGSVTWGAWAEIGEAVECSAGTTLAWTNSAIYTGGEVVVHDGHRWEAQWWSRNQQPSDQWGQWGPWRDLGGC